MVYSQVFTLFSVVVVAVLAHGGWGGSRHGGQGGPGSFLSNLTDTQKQAFFAIVKNGNLTKAGVQTALQAWASSIGGNTLTAFNNATAQWQQKIQQFQQNLAQRLANNTDALQAFQQIETIQNNQDITRAVECQQIQGVLNATTTAVQQELGFLARCGGSGGHGNFGHHGGNFGGNGGNYGGQGGWNGGSRGGNGGGSNGFRH